MYRIRAYIKTDGDPGDVSLINYNTDVELSAGPTCRYDCMRTSTEIYSIDGGVADWTQIEFTLSLLHYNQGNTWRFIFDAGSGGDYTSHPLYIDDISVEPIEQPLVIFPTYPNYRGMLWTDQDQTIKWKAVVQPPYGYTIGDLKVAVQVVRVSDSQVIAVITDDSLETTITGNSDTWSQYSVNDMQYSAAKLEDGEYYLSGTLHQKSDNKLLYTYSDYKIVKEDPSIQRDDWYVYLDEDGRLMTKRDGDSEHKAIFPHIGYTRSQSGYNRPDLFSDLGGTDCCTASASDPDNHRRIIMGCNHSHIPILNATVENGATITTSGHGMSDASYFSLLGLTGTGWADDNDLFRQAITAPNSTQFGDQLGHLWLWRI